MNMRDSVHMTYESPFYIDRRLQIYANVVFQRISVELHLLTLSDLNFLFVANHLNPAFQERPRRFCHLLVYLEGTATPYPHHGPLTQPTSQLPDFSILKTRKVESASGSFCCFPQRVFFFGLVLP